MTNKTTTFVLHGGQTSVDSPANRRFFKLFTDLVAKNEVKILINYWARPETQWSTLVQRDYTRISKQSSKKILIHVVNNVADLFDLLPSYDVLYIAGGEAELIEPFLAQLTNLNKALQGKVYLGSSMGSFIVSKHYVLPLDSQDDYTVHHGLGIVPIMNLCHWNIENKKIQKIELLKQENKQLPILTLNEQEYSIFVK